MGGGIKINKRIRIKKVKQRHNLILNELKKHFRLKDVYYVDGYFVIYTGKHNHCYFTIKEIPDWDFGIWLGDKELFFIGEHVALIDKFKPGRTYIDEKVTCKEDIEKNLIPKLKGIQEDPLLHFACSLNCCDFGKLDEGLDKDKEYETYIKELREETGKYMEDYQEMLRRIKELKNDPNIIDIELINNNTKDWVVTPQYTVNVILKDTGKDFDKIEKYLTEGLNLCRCDFYTL